MFTSGIFSDRLQLNILTQEDFLFILELVNSPGWMQFIGDRNIRTKEDAESYTEKIISNPQIRYWTVRLKNDEMPIGIITLIKRDYLEYNDIGFAFLPEFEGKGYAIEATRALLYTAPEILQNDKILAITTEENIRSVKLLEKLGFEYDGKITTEEKPLLRYALGRDRLLIGQLTQSFYNIFSNTFSNPEFERIYEICSASASIVKKSGEDSEIYNLETFMDPRKKILTDGTLTEFIEFETGEETKIVGNIAQRYSKYRKKGWLHGEYFEAEGNKMFQFIKDKEVWKIMHVIWEDERW